MTSKYMTVKEVAEYFNVSEGLIRNGIDRGEIRTIKVGSLHRIHIDVVEELERNGATVIVETVSPQFFAEWFKITDQTVYEMCRRGELKHVKRGRNYKIVKSEIERIESGK